MQKLSYYVYTTVHGPLTIAATESGIAKIVFGESKLKGVAQPTALTNQAASLLQAYLSGKTPDLTIPIDVQGTDFQQAVWQEVLAIPYGSTVSVASIAQAIGNPSAFRSVGAALRQNPVMPLIPTHRVISPSLTGSAALIQEALRNLEQRHGKA